ncbi:androgen-induced gene 1 protein isoform X3 [Spea bombifrons]|uniref:androgen-induced gene 1 protein isoform X3 n=1 Tax=Spea bombifrons TaxID=233779 RepID=UPI0023492ED3|nr:androgen-induced gene 1 protein isoform X3 [Spea bombifrons]
MALIPCQVLRAAILLSYLSVLCHYKAVDMPAHQTYGGSWKFLTFIDLVIQAVFFGICVLSDLSSLLMKGSDNQEQERQLTKLISLRDWMMAVLAFPVGIHTTVLPFILIEMRTTNHQYPSRNGGIATVCAFSFGYILWVCWIHHVTGVWVYPLLEYISPRAKIICFLLVMFIISMYYILGEKINSYIWESEKIESREKRHKTE